MSLLIGVNWFVGVGNLAIYVSQGHWYNLAWGAANLLAAWVLFVTRDYVGERR